MFRVSTLSAERPPMLNGTIDWREDFFGEKTGLTVSGQLQGELFATAFSDIYTFGPTFRAENSHTSRHAAEFWMIEPEMAFSDLADDCVLAETFTLSGAFCPERMRRGSGFFSTNASNRA